MTGPICPEPSEGKSRPEPPPGLDQTNEKRRRTPGRNGPFRKKSRTHVRAEWDIPKTIRKRMCGRRVSLSTPQSKKEWPVETAAVVHPIKNTHKND